MAARRRLVFYDAEGTIVNVAAGAEDTAADEALMRVHAEGFSAVGFVSVGVDQRAAIGGHYDADTNTFTEPVQNEPTDEIAVEEPINDDATI